MANRTATRFRASGDLDYAFNDAGIEGDSDPLEEDFESWDAVLSVNLTGEAMVADGGYVSQ